MNPRSYFLFAFLLAALLTHASAQVAITEMFINPDTLSDDDGEFVELFNYSTDPVDLNGWTISDDDTNNDVISDTTLIIPPGGYIVIAANKAALELAFFGGLSRPEIIEVAALELANRGDEINISDADDNLVWSVAYRLGADEGIACFLSENRFDVKIWGSGGEAGIHFDDIDPASDSLGYQNNNTTPDPNATTAGEDTASPLAGSYTIGGDGGGPGPVADDFRILSIAPGTTPDTYDITFKSKAGQRYTLQSSPDLRIEWLREAPVVATGDTTVVTTLSKVDSAKYFYRIATEGILVAQ